MILNKVCIKIKNLSLKTMDIFHSTQVIKDKNFLHSH